MLPRFFNKSRHFGADGLRADARSADSWRHWRPARSSFEPLPTSDCLTLRPLDCGPIPVVRRSLGGFREIVSSVGPGIRRGLRPCPVGACHWTLASWGGCRACVWGKTEVSVEFLWPTKQRTRALRGFVVL